MHALLITEPMWKGFDHAYNLLVDEFLDAVQDIVLKQSHSHPPTLQPEQCFPDWLQRARDLSVSLYLDSDEVEHTDNQQHEFDQQWLDWQYVLQDHASASCLHHCLLDIALMHSQLPRLALHLVIQYALVARVPNDQYQPPN
jgi:hypothetical protein